MDVGKLVFVASMAIKFQRFDHTVLVGDPNFVQFYGRIFIIRIRDTVNQNGTQKNQIFNGLGCFVLDFPGANQPLLLLQQP